LGLKETGNVLAHGDAFPQVAGSAWVAPGAFIIGDVHLGEESSVWYGAVLRGDTEPIRIGVRTNVQDGCVLHADPGYPAIVGEGCVIGHNAVVHGCEIGNNCLVGMGATILNGAKISNGSIVAAGAVVPEGREFPPCSLIVGIPAKRVGEVTDAQAEDIERGASEYVKRAASHRKSLDESR
jgi:carbonic anhydrase/acetyltransferase-like protein (isoleucine patch superfamily)